MRKPQKTVDIRGKLCPYTLIETRDALKPLKKGEVLEVISDYQPAVVQTIPSMCEKKGYPFEVIEEGTPETSAGSGPGGHGLWRILITKTD